MLGSILLIVVILSILRLDMSVVVVAVVETLDDELVDLASFFVGRLLSEYLVVWVMIIDDKNDHY